MAQRPQEPPNSAIPAGRSASTGVRLTGLVSAAWGLLLDVVYPPRCGGCDRRGVWFCAYCAASLTPPPDDGGSLPGMNSLVCVGAFDGPLRSAIHNLKYENDTPLAAPLARLVITALKCHDHWPRWQAVPPALVPVPLHPGRQRARGFNQSELIARALGRLTGWKIETGLVRVRDTRSQVGLDAARRRDNVRDAFEWRGHAASASIVLVDDVCTSGATLCECARVLLHCGAKEVSAATVARATMDRAAALPAAGRR